MFKLKVAMLSWFLLLAALAHSQSSSEAKLPAGPTQEKADAACLSCHEARIIVQQRLSKAAWIKEVDKMVKWGAEVDVKDHDALVDYFSANFSPDHPAYEAQKTASSASIRTTTKKSGKR